MNMMRKTLHSFITLRGCLFLFHFSFSTSLLFFSFLLVLFFCTLRFGLAFVAKPRWRLVAQCLIFSYPNFLFSHVWGAICFSLSCLILCECLILPLEMKSLYYYLYPSVDVVLHVTAQ